MSRAKHEAEADIARQITEDPDTAPELTDEMFRAAELWEGDRFIRRLDGKPARKGRKICAAMRGAGADHPCGPGCSCF